MFSSKEKKHQKLVKSLCKIRITFKFRVNIYVFKLNYCMNNVDETQFIQQETKLFIYLKYNLLLTEKKSF